VIYDIVPVAKPRMTQRDKWKKRPCVQRYFAYRDEIKLKKVKLPADRPAMVVFHIPMPARLSAADKILLAGTPHTKRPDIDNYLKGLLDAIFDEDSGIWAIFPVKYWAYQGGVEITAIDSVILRDSCDKAGNPNLRYADL